jgi:transcriptional regulator with XRE-family HTH domain
VIDRPAQQLQQLQKVPHVPSMPPIHSPLDDLDKRIADVGEFIKSQRETARMSVRRLADLAGVSNPYLSQIERGLRKPSAEILQQIAKALQISAETLYVRAGFLSDDADSGDNAVRDAIARDPKLTPEQRHALLNVYESFVASTRDAE